jgi:hypothetical protein
MPLKRLAVLLDVHPTVALTTRVAAIRIKLTSAGYRRPLFI